MLKVHRKDHIGGGGDPLEHSVEEPSAFLHFPDTTLPTLGFIPYPDNPKPTFLGHPLHTPPETTFVKPKRPPNSPPTHPNSFVVSL